MTEPTCASAGTSTKRMRVDGSNFGSTASTSVGHRMPISKLIVSQRYEAKEMEESKNFVENDDADDDDDAAADVLYRLLLLLPQLYDDFSISLFVLLEVQVFVLLVFLVAMADCCVA